MTQDAEIKALLNRLSVLYGSPETPDPRAFVREYETLLKKYSPQVIKAAGDYVRDHHTRRSWPTPGEVREALLAVAPPVDRTDWDAVEAERKQGWEFSDLTKGVKDDASRARVQAMVDEMKRDLAAKKIEAEDPFAVDWERGQRPGFEEMQRNSPNPALHMTTYGLSQLSKRMSGEKPE